MEALAQWLNDAVKIPYIRMDTTFRDFISEQNLDWTHMPEVNSLSLHNDIPKVGARGFHECQKKRSVENEGFSKYQEYMVHVKCPEEVEASLKVFKEEVDKLVEVTQKAVEAIQLMVARQNAFTQSIDAMAKEMTAFVETTRSMNYTSLKLEESVQENNDAVVRAMDTTARACAAWFTAADFIPSHGGCRLDEDMGGILLRVRGLQELFARRWEYLVALVAASDA